MEINDKIKSLTKVIKRPPVDIQFNDICYNRGRKQILKSVSGKFDSGHLTGILGSSGAGKTTLLNVLAGQLQQDMSGEIYINGKPRIMRKFHKLSSYIMQEDLVQPFLTVMESITIAANLKLGNEFSSDEKQSVILEVLSVIGLEACSDTKVENLSGGQKKRLIIALELVNNPPVIFLDEPTTGLDNVAMRHCMQLLKSLTLQGRTIICTLHQPSDSLFKMFDTVYFMSDGYCIYNGAVPDLVQFLSEANFPCPTNYNPADYIIEIVQADLACKLTLKNMINNGSSIYPQMTPNVKLKDGHFYKEDILHEFSTSFWIQFWVLIHRNFLQSKRNKIALSLHFIHHILSGLMIGLIFYQIGMKGSKMVLNLKYFYGLVIFFMFTHLMSPILLYPVEVKLLQREYFNRWYSLNAYYTALVVGFLPVMIITTIIFVILAYILTGQPLEWYRFFWFTVICILMAASSKGMGYAIGTIFNPTKGACVGSAAAIPLVLLGMYGIGYGDELEPSMKFLMCLSFPYHAYIGITTAILSNRGIIECDEDFCFFGDTTFALMKMGMEGKDYSHEALVLFVFVILHQIISYFVLRIKISPEHLRLQNCLKIT